MEKITKEELMAKLGLTNAELTDAQLAEISGGVGMYEYCIEMMYQSCLQTSTPEDCNRQRQEFGNQCGWFAGS